MQKEKRENQKLKLFNSLRQFESTKKRIETVLEKNAKNQEKDVQNECEGENALEVALKQVDFTYSQRNLQTVHTSKERQIGQVSTGSDEKGMKCNKML
jgi:ABC-type bacteriocin/lantibiotic exporter with double-glycine peptidase domain